MIRSICSAFVNAPLFRKRSADAKLLWYALYLHQAQHMCGLMRLDLEHMALDACLPLERTRAALVELIQHKLCQVDTQQELVCVVEMTAQAAKIIRPNWTGYKAVDKYLASLGASPLCKTVCDTLSIPYRYPIDTPPDTVPDTLLLGSDTGSESDPDTGTGSFAVGHAPPPPSGTQGALIPDVLASPKLAPERNRKPRKAPEPTRVALAWRAYCEAIQKRYPNEKPIWNAKMGGIFGRLVKDFGDDAAPLAAFYVSHNHRTYLEKKHVPEFLILNATTLHREWQAGEAMTATRAQQMDRTASNPALEILADMRRERGARSVEQVDCRVEVPNGDDER